MCHFCLVTVVHFALVQTTGELRNLNHLYAAQDNEPWTWFWFVVASVVVVAAVAASPLAYRCHPKAW